MLENTKRILVVEDNKPVLKVTIRRLAKLGFDVLQAENGIEAIDILQSDVSVDLVFTDIMMPGGLSGYDVVQWVQANRPECQLLLTSGSIDDVDRSFGGLVFLQKPYELAELQAALNSALA